MSEKKLKVYCETSFWSYLNGHRTPLQHIAVKQAATLQWWEEIASKCEIYISQHVHIEADDGNPDFAAKRIRSASEAMRLEADIPEIENLANSLVEAHAIPNNQTTDAAHIATASVYGMDVLLTWNCKHMANPVTMPKTVATVIKSGFNCPAIITPMDFIERREEFGL